ncbi:nucleotidyltransferase family protein [Phaeobacter sp. C3_T13_0]|uniref:nucleotidyltransferase family protein n=1 Tax=Phaeobacter cretensis TaxID=3342641 RepID=UPI0039BD308F
MTAIATLILAAGGSTRMRGRDKLLEEIDNIPLLARICGTALSTGQDCYVTLPNPEHPRSELLRTHCPKVTPVYVANAKDGMGMSIRGGVMGLSRDFDAVMIVPADMPELSAADLAQVIAAASDKPDKIIRATAADGRFGHPVVFPNRYFADLIQLRWDQGARAILQRAQKQGEHIIPVPLPNEHALTDLDTPEAWAAWRASQTSTEID